jgi:hypothetical protein
MVGCSLVALVYGSCIPVDHLGAIASSDLREHNLKVNSEDPPSTAGQRAPMAGQGLSKPARLAHQAADDQQIKDPPLRLPDV